MRAGSSPREICGVLEAAGHAVLALQDTDAAGVDYLVTGDVAAERARREHWMTVTAAKVQHGAAAGATTRTSTRSASASSPRRTDAAQVQAVAERAVRRADRVPRACSCRRTSVEVLEVFDPAVNKWEGILHVARHHGIEPEQIIAIGDDVNDLPMIDARRPGRRDGQREAGGAGGREAGDRHATRDDGLAQFLEELVETHAVEPLDETTMRTTDARRRSDDMTRSRPRTDARRADDAGMVRKDSQALAAGVQGARRPFFVSLSRVRCTRNATSVTSPHAASRSEPDPTERLRLSRGTGDLRLTVLRLRVGFAVLRVGFVVGTSSAWRHPVAARVAASARMLRMISRRRRRGVAEDAVDRLADQAAR